MVRVPLTRPIHKSTTGNCARVEAIMRKVLYVVGALAFAAILAGGAGVGMLMQKAWALSQDGRAYVDNVFPAIATAQGQQQLLDRATPELRQTAEPAALSKFFEIFQRLGHVVEYQGATGQAEMSYHTGTGSLISGKYVAKARFEHGDATIEITLQQRDGHWLIQAIHVDTTPIKAPEKA
jgi:hypothetical protein